MQILVLFLFLQISAKWDYLTDRPVFDEIGLNYKLNFITDDSLHISEGLRIPVSMEKTFEQNKVKYDSTMKELNTAQKTNKLKAINCGKEWIYIKDSYKKMVFETDGMMVLGWNKGMGKYAKTFYWVVKNYFVLADQEIKNLRIRSEKGAKVTIWRIK